MMQFPVLVKNKSEREFEARAIGLPEICESGSTEQEALAKAQGAIGEWLSSGKLVQVSIPGSGESNPWLDLFGRSSDDPDFDEFVQELKRLREQDVE